MCARLRCCTALPDSSCRELLRAALLVDRARRPGPEPNVRGSSGCLHFVCPARLSSRRRPIRQVSRPSVARAAGDTCPGHVTVPVRESFKHRHTATMALSFFLPWICRRRDATGCGVTALSCVHFPRVASVSRLALDSVLGLGSTGHLDPLAYVNSTCAQHHFYDSCCRHFVRAWLPFRAAETPPSRPPATAIARHRPQPSVREIVRSRSR
jgi:hypothetical protein